MKEYITHLQEQLDSPLNHEGISHNPDNAENHKAPTLFSTLIDQSVPTLFVNTHRNLI